MGLGSPPGVESLARAIQLSVSPVFLLQQRRDQEAQGRLLGHAPAIREALAA